MMVLATLLIVMLPLASGQCPAVVASSTNHYMLNTGCTAATTAINQTCSATCASGYGAPSSYLTLTCNTNKSYTGGGNCWQCAQLSSSSANSYNLLNNSGCTQSTTAGTASCVATCKAKYAVRSTNSPTQSLKCSASNNYTPPLVNCSTGCLAYPNNNTSQRFQLAGCLAGPTNADETCTITCQSGYSTAAGLISQTLNCSRTTYTSSPASCSVLSVAAAVGCLRTCTAGNTYDPPVKSVTCTNISCTPTHRQTARSLLANNVQAEITCSCNANVAGDASGCASNTWGPTCRSSQVDCCNACYNVILCTGSSLSTCTCGAGPIVCPTKATACDSSKNSNKGLLGLLALLALIPLILLCLLAVLCCLKAKKKKRGTPAHISTLDNNPPMMMGGPPMPPPPGPICYDGAPPPEWCPPQSGYNTTPGFAR